MDGRGQAGLHVAGASPPDPPVAHLAAEGIDRPPRAGGHDVEVAVEVDDRARAPSRAPAHDVEPGMARGVLGPALGRDVLDREAAALQPASDHPRALLVGLAGRVDRGQADQLGREIHHLAGQVVHRAEHALLHVRHAGSSVPLAR